MLVKPILIDIRAGSKVVATCVLCVHCFRAGSKVFDSCKTHVHCLPCGFQGF